MKILFVCLGNICRSPIAHGILEHISRENGLNLYADSAGTSAYHIGEKPDNRSIEICKQNQIDISNQSSRQAVLSDFDNFEIIFAMDQSNFNHLKKMMPVSSKARLYKLREFDDLNIGSDVPDPYYGGQEGFKNCFIMIERSIKNFLNDYKIIE